MLQFVLFWIVPGIIGAFMFSYAVGDKPRSFTVFHVIAGMVLGWIAFLLGLVTFLAEIQSLWDLVGEFIEFKLFTWPNSDDKDDGG